MVMKKRATVWTKWYDERGFPMHIDLKGNRVRGKGHHMTVNDNDIVNGQARVIHYIDQEAGPLTPGEYLCRQHENAAEICTGNLIYTGIDNSGRFTGIRTLR